MLVINKIMVNMPKMTRIAFVHCTVHFIFHTPLTLFLPCDLQVAVPKDFSTTFTSIEIWNIESYG